MSEALNATGRPITFAMCSWGVGDPWTGWGSQVGCGLWAPGALGPAWACNARPCVPGWTRKSSAWPAPAALVRRLACLRRRRTKIGHVHVWSASHGSMMGCARQVADSWRVTEDVAASWNDLLRTLDNSIGLAGYIRPGSGFNDLDGLEVRLAGPVSAGATWPPELAWGCRRHMGVQSCASAAGSSGSVCCTLRAPGLGTGHQAPCHRRWATGC